MAKFSLSAELSAAATQPGALKNVLAYYRGDTFLCGEETVQGQKDDAAFLAQVQAALNGSIDKSQLGEALGNYLGDYFRILYELRVQYAKRAESDPSQKAEADKYADRIQTDTDRLHDLRLELMTSQPNAYGTAVKRRNNFLTGDAFYWIAQNERMTSGASDFYNDVFSLARIYGSQYLTVQDYESAGEHIGITPVGNATLRFATIVGARYGMYKPKLTVDKALPLAQKYLASPACETKLGRETAKAIADRGLSDGHLVYLPALALSTVKLKEVHYNVSCPDKDGSYASEFDCRAGTPGDGNFSVITALYETDDPHPDLPVSGLLTDTKALPSDTEFCFDAYNPDACIGQSAKYVYEKLSRIVANKLGKKIAKAHKANEQDVEMTLTSPNAEEMLVSNDNGVTHYHLFVPFFVFQTTVDGVRYCVRVNALDRSTEAFREDADPRTWYGQLQKSHQQFGFDALD